MWYRTKIYLIISILALSFIITQAVIGAGDKISINKIEAALGNEGYDTVNASVMKEGTVELEGTVDLMYDKLRVFEIASQFPNVNKISNQVIVNAALLPDEIIKNNIIDELNYIYTIKDPDDIGVTVANGIVKLTGEVDFYREKMMAQTAASWQKGVKGIINEIKITPSVERYTDANIKDMVHEILNNRYPFQYNVRVMVEEGVVTLTGKTTNLWAKHAIEEDIAHLIGVVDIVNGLYVEYEEGK
ncbi:BON domain-containing protein [bacterium]|nr:BON domain-containing protein [bacterium]